jgi:predicted regulator of Ras-like GTPase activity (Roadblock/LC7/MglB family)
MFLGNILKLLSRTFRQMFMEAGETSLLLSNSQPLLSEASQPALAKITEEISMINVSMLQEVLQNFVSGTSNVQGAALVSPDGLALASVLPADMDEDRTAAMSAAMLSLGERIGSELVRGSIDRIVVEGEKGFGVVVSCGPDAVLLVLSSAAVKQGLLFLEIKRAVSQIAPLVA